MFGRSKKAQEFTISNETLIRIILFGAGSIVLFRIFENMRHPLTLIFVSFFLALALNPAVAWVSKKLKNKSRTRATAIAYLAVVTALIAFMAVIVPPLISQTRDFIDEVPETIRDLQDDDGIIGDFVRNNELEAQVSQFANDAASNLADFQGPVVSTANRVVSNIVSIITVLILAFMMLIEGPRWLKYGFGRIENKEKRQHAKKLATKMYEVVTSFVNGQVLVAAIGAGFAMVTLFITTAIFDTPSINPIAFGGLVFLFSLIPTIGVFIASSFVVVFSAFVSIPLAITMLVYFIVYQQIENATIQPYIQSKGLELTPLIVFIAVILGVGLGGILGAFVAIPIAGWVKVFIDDYLERESAIEAAAKK